jgi:Secretion system C-terminal sorting domain
MQQDNLQAFLKFFQSIDFFTFKLKLNPLKMKQRLLYTIGLLAITGLLQAQTNTSTRISNQSLSLKRTIKYDRLSLVSKNTEQFSFGNLPKAPGITARTGGATPGSIVIGTTYYDLQTGVAVARRVLRRDDGTLTAVWTGSSDQAFAQRGSEYAYYDGSSWTCINPATRLEPIKTGWPCIGMLNGKEFDMSHDGTNYRMEEGYSNGIGLCSPSDWTFSQSGASEPPADGSSTHGPIWPRMAIDANNNIVVVNNFDDAAVYLKGVNRPVVYNYSADGGASWSNNNVFPGMDSTRWDFGLQDMYDIDANGGKISAVAGFLGYDVTLWNSLDGGATWSETIVDSFPYPTPIFDQWPVDSGYYTTDGTQSVVIDDAGKTHIAYGVGGVIKQNITADSAGEFIFIGVAGLKYWEEGMTAPIWVVPDLSNTANPLNPVFDANGDGKYTVGKQATLDNTGNVNGDTYNRYTVNISLLTEPSVSYDSLGDVFITFMLAHDDDTTFDGQTYRNIYLASHQANAAWTDWTFTDITPTVFVENAFPTSARKTTDSIRLEYQEDLEPGTAVNNGDPTVLNNINYIAAANPYWVTGINNVKAIKGIDVQQNFPNPFNKQSVIQIKMDKAATINFKVADVLGKVVMEKTLNYSGGTHNITINRAQLSSGVYFYTVQAGSEQVTNKMIIE